MGTYGEVCISKEALVHSSLESEIKNSLLLSIVNSSNTCKVTSLVIRLDTVNYRSGKVLQCGLCVSCHEFLAIYKDFLHLLAIDGDFAFIVNLCTWEFSHQFLNYRPFRNTIRS